MSFSINYIDIYQRWIHGGVVSWDLRKAGSGRDETQRWNHS